jgi:hypothetical protein
LANVRCAFAGERFSVSGSSDVLGFPDFVVFGIASPSCAIDCSQGRCPHPSPNNIEKLPRLTGQQLDEERSDILPLGATQEVSARQGTLT